MFSSKNKLIQDLQTGCVDYIKDLFYKKHPPIALGQFLCNPTL